VFDSLYLSFIIVSDTMGMAQLKTETNLKAYSRSDSALLFVLLLDLLFDIKSHISLVIIVVNLKNQAN
jgi:hypothetical protein